MGIPNTKIGVIKKMNNEERKTRMQYKGTTTWINQDTGEVRTVDEFERPVGRTEPFMITYLAEIINLMETLGNKKMLVVKYILANMEKSNNTLIITTRELSEKCNISHGTVLETLKQLEKADIIKRRIGSIMISPQLMNNKKALGEATMMVKYERFDEE